MRCVRCVDRALASANLPVNAFTKAVTQVQVVIGRQGDQLLSNEAGDITRCARVTRTVSSASYRASASSSTLMQVSKTGWCALAPSPCAPLQPHSRSLLPHLAHDPSGHQARVCLRRQGAEAEAGGARPAGRAARGRRRRPQEGPGAPAPALRPASPSRAFETHAHAAWPTHHSCPLAQRYGMAIIYCCQTCSMNSVQCSAKRCRRREIKKRSSELVNARSRLRKRTWTTARSCCG